MHSTVPRSMMDIIVHKFRPCFFLIYSFVSGSVGSRLVDQQLGSAKDAFLSANFKSQLVSMVGALAGLSSWPPCGDPVMKAACGMSTNLACAVPSKRPSGYSDT